MFYSQVILAKKGPLAKVWLAAHWGDKKLARPQIFATDISQSCTDIMNPSVPLALRLSGHLLLGVVRIYSRKVKYVLNDCTEAMLKLQMAFTNQAQGSILDGSGGGKGGKDKDRELLSEKDAPTHQLVSNFGEYDQVHVVEGFCLPLPEDNQWILAEEEDDDGKEGGEGRRTTRSSSQVLLNTAHLPTNNSKRGRISPDRPGEDDQQEEEETWAPFDPDDDEEEEEDGMDKNNAEKETSSTGDKADANANDEEQSRVSDIEIVRAANDSMMSEDQTRRSSSMLDDKSALFSEDGAPVAAAAEYAGEGEDEYDFNVPFADDSEEDEQQPPPLQGGSSVAGGDADLNLDISRDDSGMGITTPGGDGANASGLGLGLDDDEEMTHASQTSNSKKRSLEEGEVDDQKISSSSPPPPTKRRRRRKRRKVVIDNNETELTNDHIRSMLANTDDLVRTMIHPATIWDEDGLGRDYKTLVKEKLAKDGIVIQTSRRNKSTSKKKNTGPAYSLTRPFLVDMGENGGPKLHPDLAKLWQDNYWKVLDQPCPFQRDDGMFSDDEEDEEKETKKKDEEEESVDDIEQVRRGKPNDDDSDMGSQLSMTAADPTTKDAADDDDEQPPPDEDDFNMPVVDDHEDEEEEDDVPVLDFGDEEEDEHNLDIPDADRTQDEIDMLELGMVNDMMLDSDQDGNDEDDEDRQAIGDIACSSTKWHKHTVRVFQHLKKSMKDPNDDENENENDDDVDRTPDNKNSNKMDLPEQMLFKELTRNVTSRRNAASVFFEMLQLKTWDFIHLDQQDPYGDITISPGVRFDESPPK